MTYDPNIPEEELKNRVARDAFGAFDCARIFGKVDFCVSPHVEGPTLWETESLLWAEAKKGIRADFAPLFAQLVLTVGGERTFEKHSPPPFLGAFDCEKIAFLPWHAALDLFFRSDVDWTATPSKTDSPAFLHVLSLLRPVLDAHLVSFRFDDPDLPKFVKKNLFVGNDRTSRLPVTRNNFPFVYQKWLKAVKPSIAVNWEAAKKQGIHDADFFLADLLSKDNATLMEKLFVVLRGDHYNLDRKLDAAGFIDAKRAEFNDGQKAHAQFWNQYKRPPRRAFWDFINERRDLLMPADIRERQGSFFTPQIWVEKAQEAIAAVLGESWQDEYCVWDCAAGTGNLLAGLDPKAKYRVWASTLQQADVDVMRERIRNGAALLDSHVFRFDFLNGSFEDLPDGLRKIVADPEKRKKLVVFINPPYAEATNARTVTGTGSNRPEVAKGTATHAKYKPLIGAAANEMFALFLIRIAREIPGCVLAQFSTLKHVLGSNFKSFRENFGANIEKAFLVPANTFDNVTGDFPIGFFVWRTGEMGTHVDVTADVFDSKESRIGEKRLSPTEKTIANWTSSFMHPGGQCIGYERMQGSDFQNCKFTNILNGTSSAHATFLPITAENLIPACIHFAVRLCIAPDWLNDRDQFLWPADTWKADREFQLDCLVFTLFHGQNRISCRMHPGNAGFQPAATAVPRAGCPRPQANHWIPFFEDEVGARDCMKSHFMAELLRAAARAGQAGRAGREGQEGREAEVTNGTQGTFSSLSSCPSLPSAAPSQGLLFAAEDGPAWDRENNPAQRPQSESPETSRTSRTSREALSPAARRVLAAGRELWRYYHAQPDSVPDASFYDIRAHFQGFKPNGHMNADSPDAEYTRLISSLRAAMKSLAACIAPKVREHGFLR